MFISDSTPHYNYTIKETKRWVNREIEETNLNVKPIEYQIRKKKISESINRVNKQKKEVKNTTK